VHREPPIIAQYDVKKGGCGVVIFDGNTTYSIMIIMIFGTFVGIEEWVKKTRGGVGAGGGGGDIGCVM